MEEGSMKIALTSTKPNLEGTIDPRFGRCTYFLIVDPDTLRFEALENPNASIGGGAGIQSAQLIAEKHVGAIITGNCGPKAFRALSVAGVDVVIGVSGSVKEAIQDFKAGHHNIAKESNVPSHSGINSNGGKECEEEIMPRQNGARSGGQGRGSARGAGRGRAGGFALGPGGNCVCPGCGETVPHQQGIPCYETKCPSCGAPMTRQK
jgi:predicted Fe-Mo cluster-binding NifX family protein